MHSDYDIFDAHCDTLDVLGMQTLKSVQSHFNLEKASRYKSYTQVMAVFVDKSSHKNPYMRALGLIERYYIEIKNQNIQTVLSKEDLTSDKIRMILGIEGGEAIEGSAERLVEFYNLGVRLIGITWNTPNALCGTNTQEGIGTGLTEKGKTMIKKMEELGMMIDVSHMSEKGFYDVLELAEKPFIASHSNAKGVCPHSRNLTDGQFKALCGTGGVAGINLCPLFLGESPGISTVIKHIEHFLSLGGEDNIGIGADFDGIDALPQGISGSESLYLILDEMLKQNYSESLVKKIAFKNFNNVFFKVLK
jgi:membrane dipeptidase